MDYNKLNKIKKDIDKLKVIDSSQELIESNSKFVKIINGWYKLNNKKSINREIVYKNIASSNAVSVIGLTLEKNIIIVIQPRVAVATEDKVSIELPAGYIEKGESSIDAAKRELLEETGYICSNLSLIDSYYSSLGGSSERVDLVLATDCYLNGKQNLDKDEYIIFEEVTIDEFKYLIDNGYVFDVNSKYAYLKLKEILREK